MQRRGSKQTAKRPRTSRRRTRKAATAQGSTGHSAEQFDGLKRERDEAREQQAATAEILRVIRASPSDVQPVFETIVRNAVSLCGGLFANVFRFDGELLHFVASHNVGPSIVGMMREKYPMRPDFSQVSGRVLLTKSVVWLEDALADPDYDQRFPRAMGWRRLLGVPMLREGEPLGVIGVGWAEQGPASKVQEELLKTFADQAVIAIENTRLLNELRESLQQQTATADVLKVISRSTFDLDTVLNTLSESATRLCEADGTIIWRPKDGRYKLAACYGLTAEFETDMRQVALKPRGHSPVGRAVQAKKTIHIPDMLADPEYVAYDFNPKRVGGYRAMLGVPLMREGVPIGAMMVGRLTPKAFTEAQIALVTIFADQAVIAIENVRLFEAEQQRTRELSESLEQQTATSEVLRVISSSQGELQPVFDTLLDNATRLCAAKFGTMFFCEGNDFRVVAQHKNTPPALVQIRRQDPILRAGPGTAIRRSFQTKQVVQVADIMAEKAYSERDSNRVALVELGGYRAILSVPMLKDNEVLGIINIYRQETGAFGDKQVELVKNFASQAVIAIENARLLTELRQRTDDLSRSLEDLRVTQDRLVHHRSSPCSGNSLPALRMRSKTRSISSTIFQVSLPS